MGDTATETTAEKVTVSDLDKAADAWEKKEAEGSVTAEVATETSTEETAAVDDTKTDTKEAAEVEEVKADEVDPEKVVKTEKKSEPENAEPSRLGRKLSKLKEQMDELKRTLAAPAAQPAQVQESEDDFVMPDTKVDLEKFVASQVSKIETSRVTQAKTNKVTYEYDYLSKLEAFEKDPSFAEITAELFGDNSSFNKTHERNGVYDGALDAEINYANAKNFILQKKLAELQKPKGKENPLKGKAAAAPLGVGGDTKVTTRGEKTPTLDAAGQSFVDDLRKRGEKVSDDFIKKAMSRADGVGMRG